MINIIFYGLAAGFVALMLLAVVLDYCDDRAVVVEPGLIFPGLLTTTAIDPDRDNHRVTAVHTDYTDVIQYTYHAPFIINANHLYGYFEEKKKPYESKWPSYLA